MTERRHYSIRTMLMIFPLLFIVKILDLLPWWGFVIPMLALGALMGYRQWKAPVFGLGFLTGFVLWCGANVYFMMVRNNRVLGKIGLLISIPETVVVIIAGLIGGLLTGLALYTGKCMTAPKVPGNE